MYDTIAPMIPLLDKAPNSKTWLIKPIFCSLRFEKSSSDDQMNRSFKSILFQWISCTGSKNDSFIKYDPIDKLKRTHEITKISRTNKM